MGVGAFFEAIEAKNLNGGVVIHVRLPVDDFLYR